MVQWTSAKESGNKTDWETHLPKCVQAIQQIAYPVYCCGDPPSESMKNCTQPENERKGILSQGDK